MDSTAAALADMPPDPSQVPDEAPRVCSCGRVFKNGSAQLEHMQNAQVHQNGKKDGGLKGDLDAVGDDRRSKKKNKKNKKKKKQNGGGDEPNKGSVSSSATALSLDNRALARSYRDLPERESLFSMMWPFGYLPFLAPESPLDSHWCYLGEITKVVVPIFLPRLCMAARDRRGDNIMLAFRTPLRGLELSPALARAGHTILVMYATQDFIDDLPSILVEDIADVKIIPMGLDKLLKLSNRVPEYFANNTASSEQTCDTCRKTGTDLKRCTQCRMPSYCNKMCQSIGWKNGHKDECRILRDQELQSLLKMDWSDMDHLVSFATR